MLSGIGIWQLLIILVIVLLLFGTKRLKGLGGDLGGAIKGFKKAMGDEKEGAVESEEQKKVAGDSVNPAEGSAQAPVDASTAAPAGDKEKTESK